ncbi:hypothetical protein DKK66_11320 [Aquitalea sp. USM4]|nr:hypothetical protein DKK66_11320 [Aquitalea sp. USM4]
MKNLPILILYKTLNSINTFDAMMSILDRIFFTIPLLIDILPISINIKRGIINTLILFTYDRTNNFGISGMNFHIEFHC